MAEYWLDSIIYLAGFVRHRDQEQYEAARIDGANRLQQIAHITIPGILPTIMILFVLRMGSILNVGYEKVLLLYTANTYEGGRRVLHLYIPHGLGKATVFPSPRQSACLTRQ